MNLLSHLYARLAAAICLLFILVGGAVIYISTQTSEMHSLEITQRINRDIALHAAEDMPLLDEGGVNKVALNELAHHAGLSRRQLERLFQKYLHCVPTRYYMRLRLMHARQLLLQTSMPIVDIAFASGFVSTPHFSKCYREYFGIPPRDERKAHRALN